MKKIAFLLGLILMVFITACSDNTDMSEESTDVSDASLSSSEAFTKGTGGGSDGGSDNGENNTQAGIVTAGEWNDLSNWTFWKNIEQTKEYADLTDYWSIYTNNRISVLVKNNNTPLLGIKVSLFKNTELIWETITDNFGRAELWIAPFQKENNVDLNNYSLKINDSPFTVELKKIETGIVEVQHSVNPTISNKVEICFIVDATGSMGDEITFLKDDLQDILNKIKSNTSNSISTSTVFYRDTEDDYLTKKSDFTTNFITTTNFIKNQTADGGGDFPEAVHSALEVAINDLQWSNQAKSKIAFLLLDAPPHYKTDVILNLQKNIKIAAQKGIKIIPITASGIDKSTEFLMRYFSILTNGTYVFITNHSGVGNDHIEATVGDYQVETLNNLIVRLIEKYSN